MTTWDGLTAGGSGGSGGSGGDGGSTERDGGTDASVVDAGKCTPTGHYCGGDEVSGDTSTLYTCNGSLPPSVLEHCAHGCMVRPGKDDRCKCDPSGAYCGGDKLDGDPGTLYQCNGDGTGSIIKHCTSGCKVMPGADDVCG